MPPKKTKLKRLQDEWYAKIAATGFEDIEDVNSPNEYLKTWHSFDYISEERQLRKAAREAYQERIEAFLHSEELLKAAAYEIAQPRSVFTEESVVVVWEMHCEGRTAAMIAKVTGRPRSTINKLIVRLIGWMEIL